MTGDYNNLTEKERIVMNFLKENLDDDILSIAYSEMESSIEIGTKQLRGVIASLLKKKMITHDYESDVKMSFIGLR